MTGRIHQSCDLPAAMLRTPAPAMPALTDFPLTARWAARHPERIQLYSLNTPNGVKVSIMLEECGLAYEHQLVRIEPVSRNRWCHDSASGSRCGVCSPRLPQYARSK